MLRRLGKRAQSTAEYAILIAIVVGAIVAMQVYVRRGLQGRVRDVVDDTTLGGNVDNSTQVDTIFGGAQYEPYYVTSTATTSQTASDTESLAQGGSVARTSSTSSTASQDQTLGWTGH